MQISSSEICELISKKIAKFDIISSMHNEGRVISVSDGIIQIYGLSDVMQGEMLSLPGDKYAIALNLEKNVVGAIVMGEYTHITEGTKIISTGRIFEIPVGSKFLGRVINALGVPIDGKGRIQEEKFLPVEINAPGVIDRQKISEPLQTGYKSIDAMVPIGKGQRELIIGDRQTGKTSLAIDTIINQRNTKIKCIYVAIGQKFSTIVNLVRQLEDNQALNHTIVIVASASESAALQYLVPYSGCSLGEFFRDQGKDALIVYDDLSKHAIAYRQISLLLRRPPGREAFPGDIFYLHARLLERACRVNSNYLKNILGTVNKFSTGSLTALPIIETQDGDVSSFIPTNVISITDGQIFLESNLFNSGIRPAINPGISVSRVGGAAQCQIIRKLSSGIRTSLAQYQELIAFSQFSSELDEITRNQLIHGKKLIEILKQKQYHPMSIAEQAIILFAAENNFLNDVSVEQIIKFEKMLLLFFNTNNSELVLSINNYKRINDVVENQLSDVINAFKLTKCWS
ncbi:ATP synthase subunit alpha [Buchnera aphidicola str. Bp (Baizongia pistaciae)]|uniref:ATP synthase subunit alpha n=1 Tax=Buchnera aphidicola subsp. Baizongia pistaciae (strain Bp) TaxID=224915 RepID=ATPA_BUCBP|nr:F0F1 ATP synthase subunit alpha [Buchnera aphidicola]Q89B41.1 RecName: Full=ATP synthase subunit alpha; AltName: Full=ATP synthase F1 sector subunit alpha; AltName: Full=F-ATPase subunit alpha [Buchnera aphidicola str. Bp (Baizongia pistaciae)]AAO26750.1 ATP synthase subunit alpha [Buchnera aphidicola str. Bp (Baizongia pistaciae)]